MKSKPILHIRGLECRPEFNKRFNDWYSGVHIPMLLKFKKVKSATRYKRVGDNPEYPAYLTIYEFDSVKDFEEYRKSPEFAAAVEERKASWPSGGFEGTWDVRYEFLKRWGK